ncbi:TPA: transposase [Legionella pneumophila]|nr:transposase [Legionella pneumophila]HAU0295844.1 transposase [Legionella pneumophila]HAU0966431.1 transposase [Legionella pneumophila]
MPPGYGDWKSSQRRFCRWHGKGLWERLLEILVNKSDYE